jgi:alpha-tubulin suppressor-like RCC1 family protein
VESTPQALTSGGTSNANLQLQVLTNSCSATQAQQFFQVANSTSAAVKLSDLKIKFWLDDTSASAVAALVNSPGCVSNAGNPSCVHLVPSAKASITATRMSSACGPDANHQANWEIAISYTDTYAIPVGGMVANVQTALHLSNYGNFTPGTSKWYSPCLTGTSYAANNHFALYYQGNLVISSGVGAPDCQAPHGTQHLTGHITPTMAAAPLVGPVPGQTSISLSVNLQLKTPPQDLVNFANQASDPDSPSYRQYLTVDSFRDKFGATAENYSAVQTWATSHGLTVVKTFPNNLVVGITGTAAAIQQALYLNLNYYLRPDGTKFYGPDREPSVDTTVPLFYVGHLDNMFVTKQAAPSQGSGAGNWYIGDDLRNAYAYDTSTKSQTTLTGAGQCVGLVAGEGFSLADLRDYWTNAGRNPLNMPLVKAVDIDGSAEFQPCYARPVVCDSGDVCGASTDKQNGVLQCSPNLPANQHCCGVDWDAAHPTAALKECYGGCPLSSGCDQAHMGGFSGTPTDSPCAPSIESAREITTDIQAVMAIAPGSQIYAFMGGVGDQSWEHVLTAMANSTPLCQQLSSSWAIDATPANQRTLLEFVAKGQTFFHASGDWGAGPWDSLIEQPNVTAVGGTLLSMNPPGATYLSETAWPTSGGWIASASAIPIPDYQVGVATGNGASSVYRNLPDVALPADNYEFDMNSSRGGSNGTSFSSPLWAGFMALVNQQCSINGLGPVGFANPVLYAIARTRGTKADIYDNTCFHDVKTGANDKYSAGPGYDLVTGLGSPMFKLIGQLASSSPASNLAVAVGVDHSCAIRNGGSVSCWGYNDFGQLGNSTVPASLVSPVPVIGLPTARNQRATSICAGASHTCVVLANKKVWCWGAVSWGENPTPAIPSAPVQTKFSDALAVACGWGHTCVLTTGNTVECAGSNIYGQLGNNSTTSPATPVALGLNRVSAIGAGQSSTCVVVGSDSHVECWGEKFSASGNTVPPNLQLTPTPVKDALGANLAGVASVAVGAMHACALMMDNSVRCWGDNGDGEIGDGTGGLEPNGFREFPTDVVQSGGGKLTGVKQIALGWDHSCALMSDTTVQCWGDNDQGELGDGTAIDRYYPTPVPYISQVTALSANAFTTCSLGQYGVSCWGGGWTGSLVPETVHFF